MTWRGRRPEGPRSGRDEAGRTGNPSADQPKIANRCRPAPPIRVKAPPAAMRCRAGEVDSTWVPIVPLARGFQPVSRPCPSSAASFTRAV